MEPQIQFEHVFLKHPAEEGWILKDIQFSIFPGDFVILLGANGAGKSSLFRLLMREQDPTAGRILFRGQPATQIRLSNWRRRIKILTQHPNHSLFPSFTVFEHFKIMDEDAVLSEKTKKEKTSAYLFDFNPNLSSKLDETVLHLSGGESQALALALAVLNPPEVLLLDEHTSALDPQSAIRIMALTEKVVRQHGITCLLTTHNLKMAQEYGDRIVVFKRGQIDQVIERDLKSAFNQEALFGLYQGDEFP